ncbi:hypothetical protein D0Y65_007201 [Glycine soja]|uniref:Uncharacterized protein n=1 Tax=Glycine soja TaxID=3848 RepID=A0A445LC05_GLYSO|nr:hypothetical protein D0Y65_007201 [Glycine soja]
MLGSGSINGTLFIKSGTHVVLWNPTTKQFKVIPPSPIESVPPFVKPAIHLHGLSYDHVIDDYKVIRHVTFFEVPDDFIVDRRGLDGDGKTRLVFLILPYQDARGSESSYQPQTLGSYNLQAKERNLVGWFSRIQGSELQINRIDMDGSKIYILNKI